MEKPNIKNMQTLKYVSAICIGSFAISLFWSITKANFYLSFINSLSYIGIFFLVIGFFYHFSKTGDLKFFKKVNLEQTKRIPLSPVLIAGILITVVAIILTITY